MALTLVSIHPQESEPSIKRFNEDGVYVDLGGHAGISFPSTAEFTHWIVCLNAAAHLFLHDTLVASAEAREP